MNKRNSKRVYLAAMTFLVLPMSALCAQQPTANPGIEKPITRKPLSFVTRHHGVFNGISVDYSASVAETILPDPSGRPAASLVSIAYIRNNESQTNARPVTFIFNGGPGSSSVWLHMAALGPRRAAIPADGKLTGSPPYPVVDNQFTLLDVSDLVFIDPIGTGYSRLLSGSKPEDFYGTIEDGRSMCDFLSAWLTATLPAANPTAASGTGALSPYSVEGPYSNW